MIQTVKLKRLPNGEGLPLPTFTTAGAAGADIYSAQTVTLKPGATVVIPTGFAVEVPEGYELQVRSRSGLAANHGIFATNGPGTIDSDYRGEIKVILSRVQNRGLQPQLRQSGIKLNRGDRIAQLILAPVQQCLFEEVEELSDTARGTGGFGSTGMAEVQPLPHPMPSIEVGYSPIGELPVPG